MNRISPNFNNGLTSSFLRDTRGNMVMMFAITLLPMLGAIGASVDYTRIKRAEKELQNAVDTAVLAAAKQFGQFPTTSGLEDLARNYLDSNFTLDDRQYTLTFSLTPKPSETTNSTQESVGVELVGSASFIYPLTFAKTLGYDESKISAIATAVVHANTVEAVFVFDASGSMTDNDGFQKSTKAAKDMLHDMKQFVLSMQSVTGTDTEYFRYALLPFAHSVNIGSSYLGDDNIMDTLGLSLHHHDNVDWTQSSSTAAMTAGGWKEGADWLTRWTLLDKIGDGWLGCVEARPGPYFLDDTAPDVLNADTLYVPLVAPDEPDNLASGEIDYPNNYLNDIVLKKNSEIELNGSNSGNDETQAGRLEWTTKYNIFGTVKNYNKAGLGPNRPCLDYAIYPLNGDFGQTNAEISHINNTYAASKTIGTGDDDGATNIQQGIVWGWRVISSNEPFTEGRVESDLNNKKVMIVISDGINSYGDTTSDLESNFGAFGFAGDGRLDYGITNPELLTTKEKMDIQTLQTCANAKAAGILIFVIGYGVPAGSTEENLLSQCSGGGKSINYYYSVDDSDALAEAFSRIKDSLTDIALAS